jgi:hypothetical protein
MNTMTNRQLHEVQQRKIKEQESELTEIVGHTTKGRKQAKQLREELHYQNLLLEDVDKDVNDIILN